MIEHMVAFRFRDDVTDEERARMIDELRELPQRFPTMIDFRLGRNESIRDDRFTHAFTVRFDGWDPLDRYLTSEAHEQFVSQRFRPLVTERAIVSFEF